jgi:hypothetical protein
MLSSGARAALAIGLVVMAIAGVLTERRQNRAARMGGRISGGKVLWLVYAIFLWFVVCPVLALEPRLAPALRVVLGAFGVSMWVRGLAELYLLYFGRRWRPPYGIAHDVFCLALVAVLVVWQREGVAAGLGAPLARWGLAVVVVVAVSLVLEIGYAWSFHRAVEGRTTGDEGIWFASNEEPRFRRIVRATALANVPLYAFLALFLAAVLR